MANAPDDALRAETMATQRREKDALLSKSSSLSGVGGVGESRRYGFYSGEAVHVEAVQRSKGTGYGWLLEGPGDTPVRGEVAMWRAVITQALMDALSGSNKTEMQYERSQAVVWLEGRGKDFHTVCHFAQLDPAYVRERAKWAIQRWSRSKGKRSD